MKDCVSINIPIQVAPIICKKIEENMNPIFDISFKSEKIYGLPGETREHLSARMELELFIYGIPKRF